MYKNNIGIATSVSVDKKYDPEDTLTFAIEHKIPLVQLYLDNSLQNDTAKLTRVRQTAHKNNINLVCHMPLSLTTSKLDKNTLTAALQIMENSHVKAFVFHYEERTSTEDALQYIREANKMGIHVYLENYYISHNLVDIYNNINGYNSILTLAHERDLDVTPVIDFPRLFIKGIAQKIDSLQFTKMLLSHIKSHNYPIALHLIDFNNNSQKRDTWEALGFGNMPYDEIFSYMRDIELSIEFTILEYESKKLCLDSLKKGTLLDQQGLVFERDDI